MFILIWLNFCFHLGILKAGQNSPLPPHAPPPPHGSTGHKILGNAFLQCPLLLLLWIWNVLDTIRKTYNQVSLAPHPPLPPCLGQVGVIHTKMQDFSLWLIFMTNKYVIAVFKIYGKIYLGWRHTQRLSNSDCRLEYSRDFSVSLPVNEKTTLPLYKPQFLS